MSTRAIGVAGVAVLIAVVAAFLLLGDGEDAGATESDGAFITEMTPHHEMAVEMAQIAQERAEHPEIKALAGNIISAQEGEIEQLGAMHERLFGEPVSEGDHGTLGLDEHAMGMSSDMSALETAKPFDRAFIDQMIPHHQGAIEMSRIELAEGQDQGAKDLANEIIAAQSSEIEQMNTWREEWYGAPSPAGGVPDDENASMRSHE